MFKKSAGLDTYDVDGETLVMHLASKRVHKLNPTAAFVWEQLDHSSSTQTLVDALCEACDIDPDMARKDVTTLLRDFNELGLLEQPNNN